MILPMDTREEINSGGRFPLAGRRAFVAGGTGGIGAEISRLLYARGADLYLHGRSEAKGRALLAEFAREFPDSPSCGRALGLDIIPGSAGELVRKAQANGRVDILVTAFGPFLRKSVADTGPEDWEAMASLNLALPGALVSACLPGMLASGYGRILLFGGTRTDQIRGFSGNAAYAAAKTGLGSLVKSVARAGSGRGAHCVLVCPGLVDTEYLDSAQRAFWAAKAPGGILIPAREIAERALRLALDDSGAFNGSIVSMDGGLEL